MSGKVGSNPKPPEFAPEPRETQPPKLKREDSAQNPLQRTKASWDVTESGEREPLREIAKERLASKSNQADADGDAAKKISEKKISTQGSKHRRRQSLISSIYTGLKGGRTQDSLKPLLDAMIVSPGGPKLDQIELLLGTVPGRKALHQFAKDKRIDEQIGFLEALVSLKRSENPNQIEAGFKRIYDEFIFDSGSGSFDDVGPVKLNLKDQIRKKAEGLNEKLKDPESRAGISAESRVNEVFNLLTEVRDEALADIRSTFHKSQPFKDLHKL